MGGSAEELRKHRAPSPRAVRKKRVRRSNDKLPISPPVPGPSERAENLKECAISPGGQNSDRHKQKWLKCEQCGTARISKKAIIQHELERHDWNIACCVCSKLCHSFEYMVAHARFRHGSTVAQCDFCKSKFGLIDQMKKSDWLKFKEHLFGELFYLRLTANS